MTLSEKPIFALTGSEMLDGMISPFVETVF